MWANRILAVAASVIFGVALTGPAGAQSASEQGTSDWPTHSIRLIVPASAGGASDAIARIISDSMSQSLGQPVIVTNVPSASSILGFETVAKSAPDGYTIGIGSLSTVLNPLLSNNLPYDPAQMAPVSQITTSGYALVVNPKQISATNLPDFVKLLKEKPGAYNFGSTGVGSTGHLITALFMATTGTQMTHVPYKSSGESETALLGGEVQMTTDAMVSVLPNVRAGTLRALAVATPQRTPELPDVPTIKEFYPDFPPADQWLGIFTRTGVPKPIIDKLSKAVHDAVFAPDGVQRLAGVGSRPVGSTPEEFAARLKTDTVTWAKVVKDNDITAN